MNPSNQEPERYNELSLHYLERADEYLEAGDRVQASEKGWGAVAEAIKSIAEQRGWNHQGHRLLNDIAYQLTAEWERPDLKLLFDAMEKLHINFYEDTMELDDVAASIGNAKSLLHGLEEMRSLTPRYLPIETREQRNRWRRLTGELLPMGSETDGENSQ